MLWSPPPRHSATMASEDERAASYKLPSLRGLNVDRVLNDGKGGVVALLVAHPSEDENALVERQLGHSADVHT